MVTNAQGHFALVQGPGRGNRLTCCALNRAGFPNHLLQPPGPIANNGLHAGKKRKGKRQWRGLWGAGSAVADLHPGRKSGWVICSTNRGSGRSGAFWVFNTTAQTDNLMGGANRVNMQTAHEGESGRGGDSQMRKKGGAGMTPCAQHVSLPRLCRTSTWVS